MGNENKETVEQFLARGGKIKKCKAGSRSQTMTNREFLKRDPQLKELNKLKNKLGDDKAAEVVDSAIQKRKEILR